MHDPITSVTDADEARYERREAEKRGGGQEEQEGHRGHHGPAGQEGQEGQQGERNEAPYGHDERIWSADWLSGPRGPRCRVNLSAVFEAEWSAHSNAALRLDS